MWTDMSEIVRPTRDGIHGREYINTCFELSRRVTRLEFNTDMSLASEVPPILELPLPLLFQLSPELLINEHVLVPMAAAAKASGHTDAGAARGYHPCPGALQRSVDPLLDRRPGPEVRDLLHTSRAMELADGPDTIQAMKQIRASHPQLILLVGLDLDGKAAARAVALAKSDVDSLHFTPMTTAMSSIASIRGF